MSTTLTGGPAFPITMSTEVVAELERTGQEDVIFNLVGITKRDYFAARALQGFVTRGECGQGYAERVARMSYNLADAMLKERAQ